MDRAFVFVVLAACSAPSPRAIPTTSAPTNAAPPPPRATTEDAGVPIAPAPAPPPPAPVDRSADRAALHTRLASAAIAGHVLVANGAPRFASAAEGQAAAPAKASWTAPATFRVLARTGDIVHVEGGVGGCENDRSEILSHYRRRVFVRVADLVPATSRARANVFDDATAITRAAGLAVDFPNDGAPLGIDRVVRVAVPLSEVALSFEPAPAPAFERPPAPWERWRYPCGHKTPSGDRSGDMDLFLSHALPCYVSEHATLTVREQPPIAGVHFRQEYSDPWGNSLFTNGTDALVDFADDKCFVVRARTARGNFTGERATGGGIVIDIGAHRKYAYVPRGSKVYFPDGRLAGESIEEWTDRGGKGIVSGSNIVSTSHSYRSRSATRSRTSCFDRDDSPYPTGGDGKGTATKRSAFAWSRPRREMRSSARRMARPYRAAALQRPSDR